MKFRDENKPVLKLVMDPRGQVQDLNSLRRQGYNIEPGSLSPEVAFDLVRDLNSPKGKGMYVLKYPTTVLSCVPSRTMECHYVTIFICIAKFMQNPQFGFMHLYRN